MTPKERLKRLRKHWKCMKRRKLLYLADKGGLGKYITLRFTDFEDGTEWQKQLKRLAINYRYANNLKTIISSERMISELLEIDEATFGRVVEKCGKYLVNIVKDKSKNHRLQTLNLGGNF